MGQLLLFSSGPHGGSVLQWERPKPSETWASSMELSSFTPANPPSQQTLSGLGEIVGPVLSEIGPTPGASSYFLT